MTLESKIPALVGWYNSLRLAAGISVYQLAKRSGTESVDAASHRGRNNRPTGDQDPQCPGPSLSTEPEQLYDAVWQEGAPAAFTSPPTSAASTASVRHRLPN